MTPESLANWTRLTEKLGFHFVAVSDHVAVTPDVAEQYPAPFYDPFTTLAWLSGITETLELATTVAILPYRHPLQLARVSANLDRISNGRFILGVGVGWAREEFEALGVDFSERGAIANDYLAAIKTLWTEERASYDGAFVSFRDVQTAPKPVRDPHPPIWVGGSSQAALRRAVRYGDGWHPIHVRTDWLEAKGLPRLRQIADTEDRAMPVLCPRIKLTLTPNPLPESDRVAGEGSIDQVRRDFETLEALGASHVLLDTFTGDLEATRHHETFWEMLTVTAEQILDLPKTPLRGAASLRRSFGTLVLKQAH